MPQPLATGRGPGWGRSAPVDLPRAADERSTTRVVIALIVAIGMTWWLLFRALLRWLLL
jgi:hypothetical protein